MNRERPVITGMGTSDKSDMETMSGLTTPLMERGIELGVGRGRRPISNYPGMQAIFRPVVRETGRRPSSSIEEVMRNLETIRTKLARVTVKTSRGTDREALRELISSLRKEFGEAVEIVLSSLSPELLMEGQESGLEIDGVQQRLDQTISTQNIQEGISHQHSKGKIIPGAEISFPFPTLSRDPGTEIEKIVKFLEELGGHDSHVGPIYKQEQVRAAIIGTMNTGFSARSREKHSTLPRLRGIYVNNPGNLNFDIKEAQFLGM